MLELATSAIIPDRQERFEDAHRKNAHITKKKKDREKLKTRSDENERKIFCSTESYL
jgi:hypothetical protein